MPNILNGTVTKVGAMAKTITVTITKRYEHPKYLKQLERTTKMLVHDELGEARIGDKVSITHTHPISSSKHFYLSNIDNRPAEGSSSSAAVPVYGRSPPTARMRKLEKMKREDLGSQQGEKGEGAGTSAEGGGGGGVLGALKDLISGQNGAESRAT